MKKLALALTAIAAFGGQAIAADMPARIATKAPPVVAPVTNWTGCYIAGGGGGSFASRRHLEYDTVTNANLTVLSNDSAATGWFGTVQGGCDYQFGNFVVGAFADYDFSDINGQYGLVAFALTGTWKQDYSWAAGARVGYLVLPQLLTYVSAGFTQAHFNQINFALSGTGAPTTTTLPGQTRDGWFVGTGDEYALSFLPGLFWKTEYRYSRFDGASAPFVTSTIGAVGDRYSRIDEHSVRSELVYRFNWGGPVVARY